MLTSELYETPDPIEARRWRCLNCGTITPTYILDDDTHCECDYYSQEWEQFTPADAIAEIANQDFQEPNH